MRLFVIMYGYMIMIDWYWFYKDFLPNDWYWLYMEFLPNTDGTILGLHLHLKRVYMLRTYAYRCTHDNYTWNDRSVGNLFHVWWKIHFGGPTLKPNCLEEKEGFSQFHRSCGAFHHNKEHVISCVQLQALYYKRTWQISDRVITYHMVVETSNQTA